MEAARRGRLAWCEAARRRPREPRADRLSARSIHFVAGKVEDTIPATPPARIALLRLDTDWYESTRARAVHLYPLLVARGVLIIDDYGHWEGARQAVDEYFAARGAPAAHRIDYSGRMMVKN